jgi:uncharacterized protein (DUF1800 family)
MAADRATVAHLLRRAGFAPTSAEVDAAAAAGYGATVDLLLDFSEPDRADAAPAPTFTPYSPLAERGLTVAQRHAAQRQRNSELAALQRWWLARMATTSHPLREKLTLYWHGHFATSFDKVRIPGLMYGQNQLFRALGAGGFEPLTQAVAKDPAMMIWLDTGTDKAAHPNENFARELMELFTLGIGNYTEDDVREAARAFTGWVVDPRSLTWAERPAQHDFGSKAVLGQSGDWDGTDVVRILVSSAASQRFLAARVWSHFAFPVGTTDPIVTDLLPATVNMTALLRAVFQHPAFVSPTACGGLVKQPVEWLLSLVRIVGVPADSPRLLPILGALGQTPFRPPNVGGWPQNDYWLTTASSMARLQAAAFAVRSADLSPVADAAPSERVDATAHLLGVSWSAATAHALAGAAADPRQLLTLALVAPESVLA